MLCLEVAFYSEAVVAWKGFNYGTKMMRFAFSKDASDGSMVDGMKESRRRSRMTDSGAMITV